MVVTPLRAWRCPNVKEKKVFFSTQPVLTYLIVLCTLEELGEHESVADIHDFYAAHGGNRTAMLPIVERLQDVPCLGSDQIFIYLFKSRVQRTLSALAPRRTNFSIGDISS